MSIKCCFFLHISEPFSSSLGGPGENPPLAPGASSQVNGESKKRVTPLFEEWFHGNLSRKEVGFTDCFFYPVHDEPNKSALNLIVYIQKD